MPPRATEPADTQSRYGTIENVGEEYAVRFERHYNHPVERVWRAVTEAEELKRWFPSVMTVEGERRPGARLGFHFPHGEAPDGSGVVIAYEPPRLFAFTWDGQTLRIELEPLAREGGGGEQTRMIFTHLLPHEETAKTAAGWEVCLVSLEQLLAGEKIGDFAEDRWIELHDHYAEEFGVDPGIGQAALEEHRRGMEGRRARLAD